MLIKISCIIPTIRGKHGLVRPRESLEKQTFKNFELLIEEHDPNEPPDFNAAMNRMIKRAKGELIVSLQDYIAVEPDGLQKFWDAYQKDKNVCWTAPVGQLNDDGTVEWDWRKHRSSTEHLNFMEWEIDWGCAPRQLLVASGGFDEELDKYWGFDNVNIGMRLINNGNVIQCMQDNPAVALRHNSFIQHPYQKLRNTNFHNARLQDISRGLKINYL